MQYNQPITREQWASDWELIRLLIKAADLPPLPGMQDTPPPYYAEIAHSIGSMTYIVSSHFKDEGIAMPDKIRRLIESMITG